MQRSRQLALIFIGLLLLGTLSAVGVLSIVAMRETANEVATLNNFRVLGQFAANFSERPLNDPQELPRAIPAGTIPNPTLPYHQRLSWHAAMLAYLGTKEQATGPLLQSLQLDLNWDHETNQTVARTPLKLVLIPGAAATVPQNRPALTQIIGLSGIGPDSALLPLSDPLSPFAGCFRYNSATPLELIQKHDGLSATAVFADTSNNLGPWLQGGPSTVRGLDYSTNAKPHIGNTGQFGGNHTVKGNNRFWKCYLGMADGSARSVVEKMNPIVFQSHMTIAGQEYQFKD